MPETVKKASKRNLNHDRHVNRQASRTGKLTRKPSMTKMSGRRGVESQNVGLGDGALLAAASGRDDQGERWCSIEDHEFAVRKRQVECRLSTLVRTLWSAILVFIFFLITLETIMSCALSIVFTIYLFREVC